MTIFLTETRERFLTEVVAQIPLQRIIEAHIFAPIRQGGVESGVAVIAAGLEGADVATGSENTDTGGVAEAEEAPQTDRDPFPDDSTDEPIAVDERAVLENDSAAGSGVEALAPAPSKPTRYRVYTARYRHTLKGPDRGRWEVAVTAEADAPLVTVESVVRGVQHRASDDMPVERFTSDQLMEALRLTREAGTGE
jgi:hypothetical protein